jgi:hypothetical protein
MLQYKPKYYSTTAIRFISQTPLLQRKLVPCIISILTASLSKQRKKGKLLLLTPTPLRDHILPHTVSWHGASVINLHLFVRPKYPPLSSSGFPVLKGRASSGSAPCLLILYWSLLDQATLARRFLRKAAGIPARL